MSSTQDPAQAAHNDALTAMRNAEREVGNPRYFDLKKFEATRATAYAAINKLEDAKADHPALADLRTRFDALDGKADEIVVGNVKDTLASQLRSAMRDVQNFERDRERGPGYYDPASVLEKLSGWVKKVRDVLDGSADPLKSERGQALVVEHEAWIAGVETRIAEIKLLAEVIELYEQPRVDVLDSGLVSYAQVLRSVEALLKRPNGEYLIVQWDALQKLIKAFENPRYADVPEAKQALARFQELQAVVPAQIAAQLVEVRLKPLIRDARYVLDRLNRDIDNRAESGVRKARKELRPGVARIARDWKDEPVAQAFLAECAKAMARAEEELGEALVIQEIQEVEVVVKPLVEKVENALARKSAPAVVDHAPRLRAKVSALEPFLSRQRAQVLQDRVDAALARIESELGAEVATAVAEAEAVPWFALDDAGDPKVQRALRELNATFASYREQHIKGLEELDNDLDLTVGRDVHGAGTIAKKVSDKVAWLIECARRAEKQGHELAAIEASHPAVNVVADAVPRLIKRAQQWKDRVHKKCDYAVVVDRLRSSFLRVESQRNTALAREDLAHTQQGWPKVLEHLAEVDQRVAEAAAILPDDHDEVVAWGARAAALRTEAKEKLTELCVREVIRLAVAGQIEAAQRYATALRNTIPDSPENERLAAALSGSADAKLKAEAQITARAALIRQRAVEAAKAGRPAYDAWAAERKPITALAGTIVQNIGQYEGKWVAGSWSELYNSFGDDAIELQGEWYQLDWDPALRDQLEAGMKRLDELHAAMVEDVTKRYEIGGFRSSTAHYPGPTQFLCEIVGTSSYTPAHEVRDNDGRVIGSVTGTPYPVPRIVLRGLASTYYVLVPGRPPSLDAMSTDGILGA